MKTGSGICLSRCEWWVLKGSTLLVPASDRQDWTKAWEAELWHFHHGRSTLSKADRSPLTLGLLLDALWLRMDSIRRLLDGTAVVCLLSLIGACALATLFGYATAGSVGCCREHMTQLLWQGPLVLFVTSATMSRKHLCDGPALPLRLRAQSRSFFTLKCGLIFLFSFLTSMDLSHPAHETFPLAADLAQTLLCVLFAITGFRWAILDQQTRCKHCLLKLTAPARMGRPSHNLLEWNGTEEKCRRGHGRLSSPELESSWCSHSRWIQ